MSHKILWIGIFAMLSLFVSAELFAQEDAIKKRKGIMKSNSKASKALKGAVKDGDFATIVANAKTLAANMDDFVLLFPKGSTADNSRAKAEIWQTWDDFKAKANDLKDAASKLASAADDKHLPVVQAQFKAVGSACGSCHKSYRAKKK